MFNVSITEVLVIFLVGCLVWGPKELVRVMRTAGFLLGKWQRFLYSIYYQINRELDHEDHLLADKIIPLEAEKEGPIQQESLPDKKNKGITSD